MEITSGIFSSDSDEWGTPTRLFKRLNNKYHFTLDPCATDQNHKCEKYYTKKENGLLQSWKDEVVYCNPPYGKSITKWLMKASLENRKNNVLIVLLLPARTDTKWFHDYIYKKHEIIFLKGRLKFNDGKNTAPFPTMLVIMKGRSKNENN